MDKELLESELCRLAGLIGSLEKTRIDKKYFRYIHHSLYLQEISLRIILELTSEPGIREVAKKTLGTFCSVYSEQMLNLIEDERREYH